MDVRRPWNSPHLDSQFQLIDLRELLRDELNGSIDRLCEHCHKIRTATGINGHGMNLTCMLCHVPRNV